MFPAEERRRQSEMSKAQLRTLWVRVRQFTTDIPYAVITLAVLSVGPLCVMAQDGHAHGQQQQLTAEQKSRQNALIKIVREATEKYKDVTAAEQDGYALQFGCVSGPDSGAMGLHYVNGALVNKGELDPWHPQIVIYEATPNGGLKLIGADFLVIADQWDKKNPGNPPELMGQLFHYFEAPNRFGLP